MKLLLAGATGLVGGHVLSQASSDARVTQIVALARRPLPENPKVDAKVLDFDRLPEDAPWWNADAVICALGTTMKLAGSREAFRRVDYDYPLAIARLARRHGTDTYVLNSALGAHPSSRIFYNRVKGELEQGLAEVGFRSLTYVRPGLIAGERKEFRPAERVAVLALGTIAAVLPRRYRPNRAEDIARALLEAALRAEAGTHVVGSEALGRPGQSG